MYGFTPWSGLPVGQNTFSLLLATAYDMSYSALWTTICFLKLDVARGYSSFDTGGTSMLSNFVFLKSG